MGWFEIISLIIGLLSFFISKKNGADTTEAALIGAGAGLGTYYVGTQTKWGQDLVSSVGAKWTALTSDGSTLTNGDGSVATAPPGAVVKKNSDGTVKRDADGNVLWKLLDTTGKVVQTTGGVLSSWGPTGTAMVIGAGSLAAGSENWWKWGLLAAGVLILLK